MEPQQVEQPHTLCPKCNNFILTSNFLIHEARCKGNNMQSSTFRNSQVSALRRRESERSRNSGQAEIEEERIPCPFCGYGQTLRQLDSHPPVCPHREVQCSLCKGKFPLSLMEQHDLVCISRQRSLPSRPQPPPTRPLQQNRDFREYDDRVRPQPRREQPQIPNRSEQNQRRPQQPRPQPQPRRQQPMRNQMIEQVEQQEDISPTIFRIIDQRRRREDPTMNLMRMMMGFPYGRSATIMDDDPFERGMNTQRRIVVLDPSALIALLAGRARPSGQTGMTKQEINKFPVTKYKNHGNAQKQEEEDMCAICYCNFQESESCMNLPCKHKFHPECIGKWLQKNPTCPLCKKNFKGNNQQQEGMQRRQIDQNGPRNVFIFDRMNLP